VVVITERRFRDEVEDDPVSDPSHITISPPDSDESESLFHLSESEFNEVPLQTSDKSLMHEIAF
jgi:hypothetical protein